MPQRVTALEGTWGLLAVVAGRADGCSSGAGWRLFTQILCTFSVVYHLRVLFIKK